MKSEPSTWSWDQQVKVGAKGEGWDGVRNYQASNNMKAMKRGDLCFFYHSVKEKDVIGIVKVIKEYHPDPTDKTSRFGMVTVVALKPLKNRVNLDQIKDDKNGHPCPSVIRVNCMDECALIQMTKTPRRRCINGFFSHR